MIILSFYYVTMRYIEDFMPSLILLITILLGWEYQLLSRSNILGKIVAVITILLASITITANILVAMPNSGKAYMIDLLNSISKLLGLK
jgi:hypothetical protein